MLIGFICGGMIMSTKDNTVRINKLFIVGTVLTFAGFLFSYGMPINKKIWSPTFVLTTCGLAASFLALLIWVIDIKGYKRWSRFFEVYVFGSLLSIFVGFIKIPYQAAESGLISIKGWLYEAVFTPMCSGDETLASLCFALCFVIFVWAVGLILYRNKIYIKI